MCVWAAGLVFQDFLYQKYSGPRENFRFNYNDIVLTSTHSNFMYGIGVFYLFAIAEKFRAQVGSQSEDCRKPATQSLAGSLNVIIDPSSQKVWGWILRLSLVCILNSPLIKT